MGLGGISIWQLLIVLTIVILLFGTKRLKGIGGDLGNAIKGFKKAMDTDELPKNDLEKVVSSDDAQKNNMKTSVETDQKIDKKSHDKENHFQDKKGNTPNSEQIKK